MWQIARGVPGYRCRLEGVQKLHSYFCIDFSKFLGRGGCTLQRNALGRTEAGRSKALQQSYGPWEHILHCLHLDGVKGEDRGPVRMHTRQHRGREWNRKQPFVRGVLTPPRIELLLQSSGIPVPAASAGAALPAALKPLLAWGTVSTFIYPKLDSHPIFLFFPHPSFHISSQHSASSSSLSTWTEAWKQTEDMTYL